MTTRSERRPWGWLFVLLLVVGLAFAGYWWCCRTPAPVTPAAPEPPPVTGLTTLYLRDPLHHMMSFATGREGGAFSNGSVVNAGTDIEFGTYSENGFTVGIEGARQGRIVDLGTPDGLQQRYGYDETAGGGQGFASIQLRDGKLVIGASGGGTQPLAEGEGLFAPADGRASAPVVEGHLYLVRLTDGYDASFERVVKLYVVAYDPGRSVTIRWFRLSG